MSASSGCQPGRPAQPLLHVGPASRQPTRDSFKCHGRRDGPRSGMPGTLGQVGCARYALRPDICEHVSAGQGHEPEG